MTSIYIVYFYTQGLSWILKLKQKPMYNYCVLGAKVVYNQLHSPLWCQKVFWYDWIMNGCAGVALRDSPMGLAAYILEKFSTWTNPSWKSLPDGGLLKKYKLEDLLDNVMIYWLTDSTTSSLRLYSEHFSKKHTALGFEKYVWCSNQVIEVFFLDIWF